METLTDEKAISLMAENRTNRVLYAIESAKDGVSFWDRMHLALMIALLLMPAYSKQRESGLGEKYIQSRIKLKKLAEEHHLQDDIQKLYHEMIKKR